MKQQGFTIIELAISLFILSMAVVGIFSAFSIVTILTSDSADRLTGTYLAQEGMEIVRNIRDTNWLNMDAGVSGATWVDGLNCVRGCEADYTTGTGVVGAWAISPWTGRFLYIDTNGFYKYDDVITCPGDPSCTKFKRKIIIEPVGYDDIIIGSDVSGSDDAIKVTVQVSWDEKATILSPKCSADDCNVANCSNCIKAEATLYDWYK